MTGEHISLRDSIVACRACKDPNILPAPRYGTGALSLPAQIMIVGQNPPRDNVRCQHGAWMIHNTNLEDQIGPHERLVWDLVAAMPWTLKEVYATQGVKCPTTGNSPPQRFQAQLTCASKWLRQEIEMVRPPIILAFGDGGHDAVTMALSTHPVNASGGPYRLKYVQPVGCSVDGVVRVWATAWHGWWMKIIHAPHPSRVGRFLNRESWMDSILSEVLS